MEIKTKCFNLQVLSETFAWKLKQNVLISIRVYFDPVGIPYFNEWSTCMMGNVADDKLCYSVKNRELKHPWQLSHISGKVSFLNVCPENGNKIESSPMIEFHFTHYVIWNDGFIDRTLYSWLCFTISNQYAAGKPFFSGWSFNTGWYRFRPPRSQVLWYRQQSSNLSASILIQQQQ